MNSPRSIMVAAAWFGLMAGLLEGAGLLALQRLGRANGVWFEILWVSPVFDVVVFGLVGAVPAAARFLAPRLPAFRIAVFAFASLTSAIWLGILLPWQVHTVALLILALGFGAAFMRWLAPRQHKVLDFWRRSLPAAAALAVLAFVGVEGTGWLRERIAEARLAEPAGSAPSILVIVVDALRADHVSAYGYARETSPNIDRLAREGVVFLSALSTAPYTGPSHASLLTGRYPHDHGFQWIERRPVYDGRYTTIAEALRERGYRTGAVSANRFWFTREQGLQRGFTHFEDYFHTPGDMAIRTALGREFEELILKRVLTDYPWRRRAPGVNRALIEWLEAAPGRPFFAIINYFDVHDPYFAPPPYRSKFSALEAPGGIINSYQGRYHAELTAAQIQAEIDAYDGAITYVDEHIGRLLSALQEMGAADDLLVFITSDHGEAFGEHGTYVHANSVYREEVHVPLIVWWGGRVGGGARIGQPVSNAAIPATIMDLLGGDGEDLFPVPSLAKLWENPAVSPGWPPPIAEMEHWPWMPETSPSHFGAMRSVLRWDTQYIEHDSLGIELYDWNGDPTQARDLADGPAGRQLVARFEALARDLF